MEDKTNFFQISICKILFPYALEFARKGNYTEAEELLKFILLNDSSSEYFILLGKIYAQRGEYQNAIVEWKKVLEIDSENRETWAAILKAEDLLKTPSLSYIFKWKMLTTVLCLVFVISMGISFSLWKDKTKIASRYEKSLQEKKAISSEHQQLEVRYQKLRGDKNEVNRRYALLEKESKDLKEKIYRKSQKIFGEYKNITDKYKEFEIETYKQIVINLKIGKILKLINNLEINIKQNNKSVQVSGKVPTAHIRDLIKGAIKKIEEIKSVDVTDVEITNKYTVLSGDELGKVAEKLYGNFQKFKDIFKANKSKISSSNVIQSGTILNLP